MKERRLFIFLLIFLVGFLFLPETSLGQEIDFQKMGNYLEFPEVEAKRVLGTLVQKFTDEWMSVTVSIHFKPEEQAVLVMLREAVRTDVYNYLLVHTSKEIGKALLKAVYKTVLFVYTPDKMNFLLDEFEKMSVKKAKEYVINWLLQKEIKVATGNIEVSYVSFKGNRQSAVFPYIFVYRPLDSKLGEIGITIYSSKRIKSPESRGSVGVLLGTPSEFSGEIDPFIVTIKGRIKKRLSNLM